MKRTSLKLFLLVSLSTYLLSAKAIAEGGENRPKHETHSVLMYNIMKYTKWPSAIENSSEFKVAVIGDKDLYKTLIEWYGTKKRGEQNYKIKYYNSVDDMPTDVQVIYLADNKTSAFEMLRQKIEGKSILTVTEGKGLAEKGSNINFKMINNILKFEMNKESIQKANLQISSILESLAIIV